MQDNIFEPDVGKVELLCWIATGMMIILVIAYFDVITAKIAIFVSKLLTGGIPVLAAVVLILWFLSRLCWRRKRWLF